jgi:hypothetical protein
MASGKPGTVHCCIPENRTSRKTAAPLPRKFTGRGDGGASQIETPKSFATRAGLNPALTAARTMLAVAGGMSTIGTVLQTIRAAAGFFSSINGGIVWLLSLAAEAMLRRRASPIATRIRSSFSS